MSPERMLDPLGPGSLEIRNPADAGEEVDAVRRVVAIRSATRNGFSCLVSR